MVGLRQDLAKVGQAAEHRTDVFVEATRLTPARYDGTPLAPD